MNYITLQGRVEAEIGRTDLSTNIQSWIAEARKEIADGTIPLLVSPTQGVHRFSWTYSSTAVSTSTGNNAWPSDFIEEISFFENSAGSPIIKLDAPYFDQLLSDGTYTLTATGTPTNYIDRGTTYDLYPSPSGSVELYLRYYAYPTALSAHGDEYTIDTEVPSLIITSATLKAARFLHDGDMVELFKQYASEYYVAACNKDRIRKFKGRQLRVKTYGDVGISYWKGMHQIGDS